MHDLCVGFKQTADRQTDRQTDRHTDRQTDGQTDRQIGKNRQPEQTGSQAVNPSDSQTKQTEP